MWKLPEAQQELLLWNDGDGSLIGMSLKDNGKKGPSPLREQRNGAIVAGVKRWYFFFLRDGIFKKGEITACFYGISNNPAKRKTDDTGERGKDYSVLE